MGGLLWNTAALSTESSQPPYGPAPVPLDGPELPSFRYPLGAQKTEQFNGGTAKEANVTGFPVSEKLAGARPRHLHVPAGVRQRLFLRVRHVLHLGLARPHAR
jgi:hypothetical protein